MSMHGSKKSNKIKAKGGTAATAGKVKGRHALISAKGKGKQKQQQQDTAADAPKKSRNPSAYIAPNRDAKDDEDMVARGAMDMVGAGESAGDAEEDESEDEHEQSAPDLNFLIKLNEKEVSRSRTELARLKKLERKQERDDAVEQKRSQKLRKQRQANHEASSEAESTDMEGLSEEEEVEGEDESEAGGSGFDDDAITLTSVEEDEGSLPSLELDDEKSLSQKPPLALQQKRKRVEVEDDLEDAHLKKIGAKRKRAQAEAIQEAEESRNKRLPVRGVGGWQDESGSDDEVDGEEKYDEGDDPDDEEGDFAKSHSRAVHAPLQDSDPETSEDEGSRSYPEPASTILTSARFGLAAPYDIMAQPRKQDRVRLAREQIAKLAADILGDPEVGLGMLRRLGVFSGKRARRTGAAEDDGEVVDADKPKTKGKEAETCAEDGPRSLPIDTPIRAAALMSQLAVFVDVLPGYRIRPLGEKEEEEKVNQETARRREWEQGLVVAYQDFLQVCDESIRVKDEIAPLAVHAMCVLLVRAPHFNFRTNLMRSLVSRLSRRTWDDSAASAAQALSEVLRSDQQGDASLEVVRLLHRMIKERGYSKVDARALDILLHLRLKNELGDARASTTSATRAPKKGGATEAKKIPHAGKDKSKAKDVRKGQGAHLSKKAVKRMREVKEIEKEMKESEAVVDVELRTKNQTETLKLLFVLYFSILKADRVPATMLGSALEGLARFAHRVNVDFFRDLLAVLRAHVVRARAAADIDGRGGLDGGQERTGADEVEAHAELQFAHDIALREALLCLVAAFELLSGQGEALNIDLGDFVSHLYAVIPSLAMQVSFDEPPAIVGGDARSWMKVGSGKGKSVRTGPAPVGSANATGVTSTSHLRSNADLLFRALDLCLLRPRVAMVPSERAGAFSKRLLSAALHWPSRSAVRALGVVRSLVTRDARLEALLDVDGDRARDGRLPTGSKHDVESARPLAAGETAWELAVLARSANEDVREIAASIIAIVK